MISIVIPAYNEQDIIAETIEGARKAVQDSGLSPFEIIVVNDGSIDQTAARAEGTGVTVLSHPHNLGYGRSLKDGILAARHDIIVIADADGTYPLDRIPDLVQTFKKGFHLVIGARQGRHLDSSFTKHVMRWVLKSMVEFTTGRKIADINSGLRVFSKKDIVPFFSTLSNAFSFTTSMTLAYMMSSKFVTFVPVAYNKRVGLPKVRLLRDSLRTLQYITEAILVYNPIKLFLVVAGFIFSLGLACLGGYFYSHNASFAYLSYATFLVAVLIIAMGFIAIQLKEILHSSRSE